MMKRRTLLTFSAPLLGLLSLLAVPAISQAVLVTKADDVCGPAVDPCVVNSTIDIPEGLCSDNPAATCSTAGDCTPPATCKFGSVVLDFGTRDVVVNASGQFNFGQASGSILCGDFTATTTNPAIDAVFDNDSGSVKLFSRRRCSTGGGAPPCLRDGDCDYGACARRCSLNRGRTCGTDPDCNIGPCGVPNPNSPNTKKCLGALALNVTCSSDAQCNLGSCVAQSTCAKNSSPIVNCSTNTDCNYGSCSVGTASIMMNGPIVGNSASPAFLDFRAADNITVSKLVNVAGTTTESDGGELSLDASFGFVTLSGKVTATSGGFGGGGYISLYSGTDVTVSEEIDATGGDFDGGSIDIDAGTGDVVMSRSIFVNSGAGAGSGGEVLALAGRDFSLSGISAVNKSSFEATGHTDAFNTPGDGGSIDLAADRDLTLNVNTRIIGNGAVPDATAAEVLLDAGRTLTFNGDITAKASGANGEGGYVESSSNGATTIGASATIDLTGGSFGGGLMDFSADGNLTYQGTADLGASNGGPAGSGSLQSDNTATVSGTMRINTGTTGELDVRACYITLTSTGKLDQALTNGTNTLKAEEEIKVNAGSLMKAGATGKNDILYRTNAKPPVILGTVSPAPTVAIDPTLIGCIVCGNNKVDGAESCDDGNTANGDGCNSDCQNEGCVAQTVPKTPCDGAEDCGSGKCFQGFCFPWICEDGNLCTADSCNDNTDTCSHVAKNCGDGVACTTDSCSPETGNCLNTVVDTACNDDNVCTNDVCSATTGCANNANTLACDDGVECTTGDICSNKVCAGTPGDGCGVCGDGAVGGGEECDDCNATFAPGEYCGVNCSLVACGDSNNNGTITTSDAQFALRAAVTLVNCSLRICDVDNGGSVAASDAQRILRKAVGQAVILNCPTTLAGDCNDNL